MTQARSTIVSTSDTPYYHCVSRCVRRAYLCGYDTISDTDYEHRRQWLENKLHQTANAFAIKLCAYAVMSNHYHVVLHVRTDISKKWSQRQVVKCWHSIFNGTYLSQCFEAGMPLLLAQQDALDKDIELWRERLTNLSWFMKVVNESIARRANLEDHCTGHFWESRFKSQALLDERALLACMAYVDLNPIRAKMAVTPETSDHTCVAARINSIKTNIKLKASIETFVGSNPNLKGLPFVLNDYLELVDWTGQIIREDKRGPINNGFPPILEGLSFDSDSWAQLTTEFEYQFGNWVGSEHIVRQVYSDKQYQRIPSTERYRKLLG
ncbi:MAG: REP element-mobilizing transposase RayT [Cryomorphaceae bacterium]|jgi:REP element-mobilizing transposase RayT